MTVWYWFKSNFINPVSGVIAGIAEEILRCRGCINGAILVKIVVVSGLPSKTASAAALCEPFGSSVITL
jgi:hypothetical protein